MSRTSPGGRSARLRSLPSWPTSCNKRGLEVRADRSVVVESARTSPLKVMFVGNQPKAMKSKRAGERAQTTAEFVLISPFLFLFLDSGWMLKNWIVVTNAAREATRCAVAQSCRDAGGPVTPEALALTRVYQGITGNLSGQQVVVKYIDEDGDGVIRPGDDIVVCVKADNNYISPVLPMFSLITGGAAIPSPLPIAAREQMRL